MASKLAERIFQAHLELSYRFGRRVTLAEFGELIAAEMGREVPFTPAAVSRWESGLQIPSLSVIEAIAEVTGVDPGWISHGEKSAASAPPGRPGLPRRGTEEAAQPSAEQQAASARARGAPRNPRDRKSRPR